MKRVSFMKHGMELYTAHVEGRYKHGDPVPVPLVKAGLQDWKTRMGWDDDGHIAAKSVWDQVRIGAQTFSAAQYLRAEKQAPQTTAEAFTVSTKTTKEEPKIFKAPDTVPDWGLADEAPPARGLSAFNSVRQETATPHNLKVTSQGEIDFAGTNEAQLQEALRKIGAKPRPPKPEGF